MDRGNFKNWVKVLKNKIKNNWKQYLIYGIGAVLVLAIIIEGVMLGRKISNSKNSQIDSVEETTPEPVVETKVVTEYVEKEKIVEVEVEKEVTQEMIQDGLNDMGILTTEEYYFTQVENYVKTETFFKFLTTTSNVMYSYDGVVTAGIDFSKIIVVKDDVHKKIVVSIPKSEIQGVDIDYDSFQVYEEKEGLWNPLNISDYNESMVEFEANAKEKALSKGILQNADESAERIIKNFVNSLVDTKEYKVEYVNDGEVTK